MVSFAEQLKKFRLRSGMSQRAVARASGINPAIINRLESGDRQPSSPEQVTAIAEALGLPSEHADSLLSAAGYWPGVILALGPRDETLLSVARVLAGTGVEEGSRARFRHTIRLLVEQWTAVEESKG
jgi:transcriptional regulator with XRE-family HTH domain